MLFGSRVEGFGNADELMTKIAAGIPGLYFIVSQKTHTIPETTSPPAKINYLLACVGLFPVLVEHQYADTILRAKLTSYTTPPITRINTGYVSGASRKRCLVEVPIEPRIVCVF